MEHEKCKYLNAIAIAMRKLEQKRYKQLKTVVEAVQQIKKTNSWNSLKAYDYLKRLNKNYGFSNINNWCILEFPDVEAGTPYSYPTEPVSILEGSALLRESEDSPQPHDGIEQAYEKLDLENESNITQRRFKAWDGAAKYWASRV